jgi:hypothetical protein
VVGKDYDEFTCMIVMHSVGVFGSVKIPMKLVLTALFNIVLDKMYIAKCKPLFSVMQSNCTIIVAYISPSSFHQSDMVIIKRLDLTRLIGQ